MDYTDRKIGGTNTDGDAVQHYHNIGRGAQVVCHENSRELARCSTISEFVGVIIEHCIHTLMPGVLVVAIRPLIFAGDALTRKLFFTYRVHALHSSEATIGSRSERKNTFVDILLVAVSLSTRW